MIYCDTSVILSLYTGDENASTVTAWFDGFDQGVAWTDLHHLEFCAGLEARVGRGDTARDQADLIHAEIDRELQAERFFLPAVTPWKRAFSLAHEFALEGSATSLARSLDVLHLGICHSLDIQKFWSLDQRQNQLASRVGLLIRQN